MAMQRAQERKVVIVSYIVIIDDSITIFYR